MLWCVAGGVCQVSKPSETILEKPSRMMLGIGSVSWQLLSPCLGVVWQGASTRQTEENEVCWQSSSMMTSGPVLEFKLCLHSIMAIWASCKCMLRHCVSVFVQVHACWSLLYSLCPSLLFAMFGTSQGPTVTFSVQISMRNDSESCPKKFSKVVAYVGSVNLSRLRENSCMDTAS